MKLTDLLEDVGRPVAYYPRLALALGGVKKAVFMCQLLYWTGKEGNREGWIRKPQREITEETGLTRDETDSVRKTLVKAGLLEEARYGEKGEMHFRVAKEKLNDLWEIYAEKSCLREIHNQENPQTGMRKTRKQECGKPANRNAEKPTSISTESTTENTTENTTESTARASHAPRAVAKPVASKAKPNAYEAGALLPLDDPLHVAVRLALQVRESSTDDAKAAAEETAAALAADGRDAESVNRFVTNWWKFSFWGTKHKRKPKPQELRNDFDEILALSEGKNVQYATPREQSRANTRIELDRIIAEKLAAAGYNADGSLVAENPATSASLVSVVEIR